MEDNISIKVGGLCLISFFEGDIVEHLWVVVDKTDSNKESDPRYFGHLVDKPKVFTSIKEGDSVYFKQNVIKEYQQPLD